MTDLATGICPIRPTTDLPSGIRPIRPMADHPAGIRPIRQCLRTGSPVASPMRPFGAAWYRSRKSPASRAAFPLTGPNRYASRPGSRTAITGAEAQAFMQPVSRTSAPVASTDAARSAPPSQFAQTKIKTPPLFQIPLR